jgi:hypothetical protein
LVLLFIIVVVMIALTPGTHREPLTADGTYDRRRCK